MSPNKKTNEQLIADRDYLLALIDCLRACPPGQEGAAIALQRALPLPTSGDSLGLCGAWPGEDPDA